MGSNKKFFFNLDEENYYDRKEHTFLLPFTEDQKEAVNYAVNHELNPEVIAYTHISANNMWKMLKHIQNNRSKATYSPVKVWKIGQTDLSEDAFDSCLDALSHDISMVDEIENIYQYSDDILYLVSVAASYNINICNKIYPGISENTVLDIVQTIQSQ